MNSAAFLGQKNWQVPSIDPTCPGYNCDGTMNPMGNLFYDQLGFNRGASVATPNSSVGPFSGLQPYLYWTCVASAIQAPCEAAGPAANFEESYSFGSGFQGTDPVMNDLYVTAYFAGSRSAPTGPEIAEVANAEGESPVIAPNTWVEIKGVSLAPDAMSGPVPVVVTNNGTPTASFAAQAQPLSPSFFVFNGGPYVPATHVNGSYLGPATLYPGLTTPAQPGEIVGTWAVPPMRSGAGPSAVSVSPGRGPSEMDVNGYTTMTFNFADSNGYGDLYVLDVLIDPLLDGTGACYFAVAPTASNGGYLYLVDDAGDGGYAAGSPMYMGQGQGGYLPNSQCTIRAQASTVSASGNTLTMDVLFTPSAIAGGFNGNVAVYLAARNSGTGNSGWQALGTWYVGTPTNPSVVLTTNLSDFQTCIGPSSAAVTCMLAPNTIPLQYHLGYAHEEHPAR